MFLSQIYTLLSLQKTKQTQVTKGKDPCLFHLSRLLGLFCICNISKGFKGDQGRHNLTSQTPLAPHHKSPGHFYNIIGRKSFKMSFLYKCMGIQLSCFSLQCPRYRQEIASWATVLWRDSDLQKKIPSHSLMVESNIRQFMVTLFFKLFFALTDQGVCHNSSLGGKNERGKQFNWLGKVWKSVRGQVTLNVLKPSSKPKTSFIIIVMNI